MNQNELIILIKRTLEEKGYSKIKVNPSLFGLCADVTARNPRGKKRAFKAAMEKKRGRSVLELKPKDDEDWIDWMEGYDAMLEDE